VYSLDKKSGDLNWESGVLDKEHAKIWTSPAIQGNTLFVSTFDGHIYALSLATGELSDWSFKSEAGFASPPVIDEDVIYVGSFDRYLYALEIGGNQSLWRFPQEKPAANWFWASPVVRGGVVYAGCLDGKLYAIEAKTGEELWEFDAGKRIVSSPVLMDNLLIVVDESGVVYVFDLSTGSANEAVPLKTISIGADVKSSFCAHDGLVYIRSESNSVYVVDIEEGEVAEGWPVSLAAGK
jgi:outer membrane protein assembly factor BamB